MHYLIERTLMRRFLFPVNKTPSTLWRSHKLSIRGKRTVSLGWKLGKKTNKWTIWLHWTDKLAINLKRLLWNLWQRRCIPVFLTWDNGFNFQKYKYTTSLMLHFERKKGFQIFNLGHILYILQFFSTGFVTNIYPGIWSTLLFIF